MPHQISQIMSGNINRQRQVVMAIKVWVTRTHICWKNGNFPHPISIYLLVYFYLSLSGFFTVRKELKFIFMITQWFGCIELQWGQCHTWLPMLLWHEDIKWEIPYLQVEGVGFRDFKWEWLENCRPWMEYSLLLSPEGFFNTI